MEVEKQIVWLNRFYVRAIRFSQNLHRNIVNSVGGVGKNRREKKKYERKGMYTSPVVIVLHSVIVYMYIDC